MKFSLFPKDYVVFDFETTGLDTKKDDVIEIGAIKIINGEYTVEHINMLLDPKRPIPPAVSAINHITDDMVKGQPTVEQGNHYLLYTI